MPSQDSLASLKNSPLDSYIKEHYSSLLTDVSLYLRLTLRFSQVSEMESFRFFRQNFVHFLEPLRFITYECRISLSSEAVYYE
jgi:hypothetical protein